MSTRSPCPILAVAAVALLAAGKAGAQEKEALFRPQDDERYDELTVVGTSELSLPAGLSRLTVPGSETTYYVVHEVRAWQADLREAFSDIYRNDSDISISTDRFFSAFIHLRLREDVRDARYIRVEPALFFQVSDFFREGGFSQGRGSVEYTEHLFPISRCPGLGAAIESLKALLLDSVASIGPVSANTVVVDGRSYGLRLRLGRSAGHFGFSENDRPLFDAVHSIRMVVDQCSAGRQPEAKTRDF